ncbi:hypothetical protein PL648_21865, partial [Phocaeicola vulgatus]|nr:hypothetical protein [Phocaeicola vulgatus]
HKTGNGPSCTDSSEVEIQFEQRKYDIFFSQENIIWRQCGLCGRLATIKKRMAYSTIFPAILYRMKCPYSPANYLKGDYEVRAVTMKEQRTTGGELKKMQYHT